MNKEEVFLKVTEIFKDVFDDDTIELTDATTSEDIEGWDSIMHITLIGAIEMEYKIKFTMKEVVSIKNVGEMVDLIIQKL